MKNAGRSFEDDFQRETGGRKSHASGATLGENDNYAGAFSCELKHTKNNRFSLKPADWAKALHRAKIVGMLPSFNIRFAGGYRIAILQQKDLHAFLSNLSNHSMSSNKHGNYRFDAVEFKKLSDHARLCGMTFSLDFVIGEEFLTAITHETFLQVVHKSKEI